MLLCKEILAFINYKVIFSAELSKLVLCKVAEAAKGPRRNVWTLTKTLSFLCRHIKICGDLHTLAKKGFLGGKKQFFLYKKCITSWFILNVILYTFCNYAQKRRICLEKSKYAADENFVAIFAIAKKLPTSATLVLCTSNMQCKLVCV